MHWWVENPPYGHNPGRPGLSPEMHQPAKHKPKAPRKRLPVQRAGALMSQRRFDGQEASSEINCDQRGRLRHVTGVRLATD